MKKSLLIASLVLGFVSMIGSSVQAQDAKSLWTTLAKVTFKKQYDEMLGFKVDVPIFSPEIKSLEGKSVEIKGYIIPVEGYRGQKEFVFSEIRKELLGHLAMTPLHRPVESRDTQSCYKCAITSTIVSFACGLYAM